MNFAAGIWNKTKKLLAYLSPILALVAILIFFFYKVFFRGYVALPGDLLVGAYYPWHEYKWGYAVDVPIKNPLLSDSFSTFFVWKKVISESYKESSFPLWNPYSYSGYPLLANFHSGALYIFNFLFMLFDFNQGWNLFVFTGILGSAVAMFILLKKMAHSNIVSLIASLVYSLSGFSITWSEFATAGHAMIWIPVCLYLIESYFDSYKKKNLLLLVPILFFLNTVGHLQMMLYGYALIIAFFIYKYLTNIKKANKKAPVIFTVAVVLSVLISSVQFLPTYEMAKSSIRFDENYASSEGYGLLPVTNLVTFFAPDFFGNPATGNYWGFFNYHETVLYTGLLSFIALIWAVSFFRRTGKENNFFLICFLISMVFLFNNPISRLIYGLRIPILSTSTAGRIVGISTLLLSLILASFLENIRNLKFKDFIKFFGFVFVIFLATLTTTYITKVFYARSGNELLFNNIGKLDIAIRNMAFPLLILTLSFCALLFRKYRFSMYALLIITIFDLFRFGWKYLPFVESKLVFPETAITDYLRSNVSNYRIEKERGALLPPNTWTYYQLSSPSGYDPMAPKNYTSEFFSKINGENGIYSRYAEITNYDCQRLGQYSVKYLLALKRDKNGSIPGNILNDKIDQKCWRKVFETDTVAILENLKVKERFELLTSLGKLELVSFAPNKILFNYRTPEDTDLVLRNSWSPGWIARVNGQPSEVGVYNDVFQKVSIPRGEGTIEVSYEPASFTIGLGITIFTAIVWVVFLFGHGKSSTKILKKK